MDPDPVADPAIFVRGLQEVKKIYFFQKFFCLLLFEGTFTSFSKDTKSYSSQKTVGINVFLTILLDDRRFRIRIQEVQTHLDPTDPDPQHCCAKMFWIWNTGLEKCTEIHPTI